MVFLFIAVFVIIFLNCIPIKVGINLFSQKMTKNTYFSILLWNLVFSPKKRKDKKQKKNSKIKLKLNKKNLDSLKLLLPDKVIFESTINDGFNPVFLYPALAIVEFFNYVSTVKSGSAVIENRVVKGDYEPYFQLRITVKINLHIIFFLFFQIIKIELKRS